MNDYEITLCRKLFALIKDSKNIRIDEIIKETNESKYMISKVIKELKEQGILERVGGRNKGYWKIISKVDDKKFYALPMQRIIIKHDNNDNNDNNDDNTLERYQKDLPNLRNKLIKNKFVFKKWYNNEKILLYYTDFTLYETSIDLFIEGFDVKKLNLQQYPKCFKIFQKARELFWYLRDGRLKTTHGKNTWNAIVKIIMWEFMHHYMIEYINYKKIIENLLSNGNKVVKDENVIKIIIQFLSENGKFYLYATECLEQYRGRKYLPIIDECIEIELGKDVIKLSKILLVAYYAIIMFIIEDLIEESKR